MNIFQMNSSCLSKASCISVLGLCFLFAAGVALLSVGIHSHVNRLKSLASLIHAYRTIRTSVDRPGCADGDLGSSGCPTKRLEALGLSLADRVRYCMSGEGGSAIQAEVAWIGKNSTGMPSAIECLRRQSDLVTLRVFSVQNPSEILEGVRPELLLLPAGTYLRATERKEVEWEGKGEISWEEKERWVLSGFEEDFIKSLGIPSELWNSTDRTDDSITRRTQMESERLLKQPVIIPNPFLLANLSHPEGDIRASELYFGAVAGRFYLKLEVIISPHQGALSKILETGPLSGWETGIDGFGGLIRRQFRNSWVSSELLPAFVKRKDCGETLRDLLEHLKMIEKAKDLLEGLFIISEMICGDNRSSPQLSLAYLLSNTMNIHLVDSLFFYERQAGCGHLPGHNCFRNELCEKGCPDPLTEQIVDCLFSTFADPDAFHKFWVTCTVTTSAFQPISLGREICLKIKGHLTSVGQTVLRKLPPTSLLAGFGWSTTAHDRGVDGRASIPWFIKTTVGQALGWNGTFAFDPIRNDSFSWGVFQSENPDNPLPSKPRSSFNYSSGVGSWIKSRGGKYSCFFDRQCIRSSDPRVSKVRKDLQPGKRLEDSNRKTWAALSARGLHEACAPSPYCKLQAVSGYDKAIPGELFNSHQSSRSFSVGSELPFFVSDIFSRVFLRLKRKNEDWGGLRVDDWELNRVEARTETCETADNQGIDCDSPIGSVNLGLFGSPDPKRITVPFYASAPLFRTSELDVQDGRRNTYDPAERVQIDCGQDCMELDTRTVLRVEPVTGAVVQGTQRLQMNVRLHFGEGSQTAPPKSDALLPVYWIERHRAASERQKEKMVEIQAAPAKVNFWSYGLMCFGLLLKIAGGIVTLMLMRKRAQKLSKSTVLHHA